MRIPTAALILSTVAASAQDLPPSPPTTKHDTEAAMFGIIFAAQVILPRESGRVHAAIRSASAGDR